MDLSEWTKHARYFLTRTRLRLKRATRQLRYWDKHHTIRHCVAPLPFSNDPCSKPFAVFNPNELYCSQRCATRAGSRKTKDWKHA